MKKINLCLTAIFLVIVMCFSSAFIILPDKEFSQQENRTLKGFPTVSAEKIADGSFSAEINEYFSDQFVARDTLVGLKGYVETAFLKGENNGVLLGENGQLAVRRFDTYENILNKTEDTDFYYQINVENSIRGLNTFAEKSNIPLVTVFPPRTVDVAKSAFNYSNSSGEILNKQINSTVSNKCGYIDLLPVFRESYDNGEYVYYKTDHHWTTQGAYMAYCEIMKKWGMGDKIIPRKAFKVEEIPSFYGTTWSRAGFKFVSPDTMEIWSVGNEQKFETICFTSSFKKDNQGYKEFTVKPYKKFDGWINREYLTQKNKYAAFLDGTHREQTVFKKNDQERERLLLVKDSFADSLVPFLVQHFDLVIINLAGGVKDASKYIDEYSCDRMLLVYNYENLICDNYLAGLK